MTKMPPMFMVSPPSGTVHFSEHPCISVAHHWRADDEGVVPVTLDDIEKFKFRLCQGCLKRAPDKVTKALHHSLEAVSDDDPWTLDEVIKFQKELRLQGYQIKEVPARKPPPIPAGRTSKPLPETSGSKYKKGRLQG